MTPKHIFIDIDGTLVGYDAKIPPSALAALKQAQRNGHKIIIATGRQRAQIYPDLLAAMDFDGIIASTGAYVECSGRAVYESLIEGDDLRAMIDYFEREGICYLLMTRDELYADETFGKIVLPYMREAGYSEELIQGAYGHVIVTDKTRGVRGVEKSSYFLSQKTTAQMSRELNDRFYVVDYSVGNLKTELFFGEITLAGVNKGSGILRYLEAAGASVEDTVAIGDSGNDIDMIDLCAVGVAMGNATDKIKTAADYVTTDVDKDGIYNAFKHLGLID